MKSFDELLEMTEQQKLTYLKEEVEKIILGAPPRFHLKLRALQAKIDGVRRRATTHKEGLELIFNEMLNSFEELRKALNEVKS